MQLSQGDIVYLNFNPQAGHEQRGLRPALVISNDCYHQFTNLAIVCPITNTNRGNPLHIELDRRSQTTGVIMCEQLRSVDANARSASFVERISDDLLEKALEIVKLFI